MDIEQTKKAIEVMQAFVDGKEIEVRCAGYEHWSPICVDPLWNWSEFDYRIAKRKETRTGWINVYPGRGAAGVYATKENADFYGKDTDRIACIKIEYEVEI